MMPANWVTIAFTVDLTIGKNHRFLEPGLGANTIER
jgi:hypothetical protein